MNNKKSKLHIFFEIIFILIRLIPKFINKLILKIKNLIQSKNKIKFKKRG